MIGRIVGWQPCDCSQGQRGGLLCARCAGAGVAPVWRYQIGQAVILDFPRRRHASLSQPARHQPDHHGDR